MPELKVFSFHTEILAQTICLFFIIPACEHMTGKYIKIKIHFVDCKSIPPALSMSVCLSQTSLCQFYNQLLPDLPFKINIFCTWHMFEISTKCSQELETNKEKSYFRKHLGAREDFVGLKY